MLYPRCMHRGTTLFYGRVEERGIRCCYHGWLFDVEGNCLEQPCEPNGGTVAGRAAARQPWYKVEECYGIVWAYMGPPDKIPVLRKLHVLEDLKPGELIWADDNSLAATADFGMPVVPYSWLQHERQHHGSIPCPAAPHDDERRAILKRIAVMPEVAFAYTNDGVTYSAVRKLDDGRELDRISAYILPNLMFVPTPRVDSGTRHQYWHHRSVDDTHCRIFTIYKAKSAGHKFSPLRMKGKSWQEMTPDERRDMPGDYEAQAGQGPISLHSEEHLATSDRGVAMQRRMLEQQIKKVMDGGDPDGIAFDEVRRIDPCTVGEFLSIMT